MPNMSDFLRAQLYQFPNKPVDDGYVYDGPSVNELLESADVVTLIEPHDGRLSYMDIVQEPTSTQADAITAAFLKSLIRFE